MRTKTIVNGFKNSQKIRVMLEVAGKNTNFSAEYYEALERFKSQVIEVVEAPNDFVTVA